jgi:hypothetical protein
MEDIEMFLKNANKRNVQIPHEFTDCIKECFRRKRNLKLNHFHIKKTFRAAIVACSIIILGTGIIFARDIINFIENIFGVNSSEGVSTATQYGYVENIDTKYQNSEGIEIKIEDLLMDDFNFAINFNIKLDKKYNIENFKSIQRKKHIMADIVF